MPKDAGANGAGPNPIGNNPPLYYAVMAIPYHIFRGVPLLSRIFVLRLFNALFFIGTVGLVWAMAGDLFGNVQWKQVVAAGAVAVQPQVAFMSAVINADNLLILLTTATLYTALRFVRRGPTLRRACMMGLCAAAAALTQGRGLVTLPVVITALAVGWIRWRPHASDAIKQVLGCGALSAAGLGLYTIFGATPGSGAYGGTVGALNSGGFNIRQFLSFVYQFYFPRLPSLQPRLGPEYGYRQVFIDTFYGAFGWLEVTFKPRVYDLLQVCSALGLVGLYTACIARRRVLLDAWPSVIVMLSLLITTIVFLHYVSYEALLTSNGGEVLIVGRYLLPMIALFGLAIAFVVGSLPARVGPLAGAAVLVGGTLLSLSGLGITMARFYA